MAAEMASSASEPQHQNGEVEYLRLLGERIRAARARRGMTRKILARDSGVSERYLAQLETGHGNISIILLRQVAQAMGLPLAELVREGPGNEQQRLDLLREQQTRVEQRFHHGPNATDRDQLRHREPAARAQIRQNRHAAGSSHHPGRNLP